MAAFLAIEDEQGLAESAQPSLAQDVNEFLAADFLWPQFFQGVFGVAVQHFVMQRR
jgi:hypothetical protein